MKPSLPPFQQALTLPLELICLIFNILQAEEDWDSVRIGTILCQLLYIPCQALFFEDMFFDELTATQFVNYLTIVPHISSLVRNITLVSVTSIGPSGHSYRPPANDDYSPLAPSCEHGFVLLLNALSDIRWISLIGSYSAFACDALLSLLPLLHKHAIRPSFRGINASTRGTDLIRFLTIPGIQKLHLEDPKDVQDELPSSFKKLPLLSLHVTHASRIPAFLAQHCLDLSNLESLAVEPLSPNGCHEGQDRISEYLVPSLQQIQYMPTRHSIDHPHKLLLNLSSLPRLTRLSLDLSRNAHCLNLVDCASWLKHLFGTAPHTFHLTHLTLSLRQPLRNSRLNWLEHIKGIKIIDSILANVRTPDLEQIEINLTEPGLNCAISKSPELPVYEHYFPHLKRRAVLRVNNDTMPYHPCKLDLLD